MEALFQKIEEYQGEKEQQQGEQVEPQPSKKRTMSEGTSQQGPQAFDSEPPWVGQMFDRMSLWNPISILEWIPWNQTSMCVSHKWMKILLIYNMMFITFMSNKDIHALSYPLFHHHLHPLLLLSCILFLIF